MMREHHSRRVHLESARGGLLKNLSCSQGRMSRRHGTFLIANTQANAGACHLTAGDCVGANG